MPTAPLDSEPRRRQSGSTRARFGGLAAAYAAEQQAPATSADAAAPVIPPGQEPLLSTMLGMGSALPGDCAFAAGDVAHSVVVATYKCPSGDVVLEITHPLQAGDKAVVTRQFAIAQKSGAYSPDLAEAVATLVRTREAEFEWKWPAGSPGAADRSNWIFEGGLIALVAIGLAGWALRRRSLRSTP